MKKIITLLLVVVAVVSFAVMPPIETPINPTVRTPISGFSPKVIQDRDLRAIKSFWLPYRNSTTAISTTIDSAGSNFQLLSNGHLAISKGLATGFFEYIPSTGGTFTNLTVTNTIVGNAATASSLANSRTLWGQSFTGAANVSGAITGVTGITSTGNYSSTSSSSNSVSSISTGSTTNALISTVNDVGGNLFNVSWGSSAAGSDLGMTRAGNSMLIYSGSGTMAIGSRSTNDIVISTNNTERARISGSGAFNIVGALTSSSYKVSSLNTAPASATATGTLGEIRITATYIYVCTANNTWVRTPLTTW